MEIDRNTQGTAKRELLEAINHLRSNPAMETTHAAIERAMERGKNREPVKRHWIVHPTYYPYALQNMEDPFTCAIRDIYTAQRTVIILTFLGENTSLMPTHVPRYPTMKNTAGLNTGRCDAPTMQRILDDLDGLHPDDKDIIHGAAWRVCVSHWAHDWLLVRHMGIFAPFSETDPVHNDHRNTVLRIIWENRLCEPLNIRYGHVFDTHDKRNLPPSDSYDMEFTSSDDTIVYPCD